MRPRSLRLTKLERRKRVLISFPSGLQEDYRWAWSNAVFGMLLERRCTNTTPAGFVAHNLCLRTLANS